MVLHGLALAGERTTEEGPQEGIQDGRHSIGIKYVKGSLADGEHQGSRSEPGEPVVSGSLVIPWLSAACAASECGDGSAQDVEGWLMSDKMFSRWLEDCAYQATTVKSVRR